MKTSHWILALSLVACRTQTQTGVTGVKVTITFDAALGLDQIRVEGTQDGVSVGEAKVLPLTPRALKSPESVAIVVPDADAGTPLTLRLDGLKKGDIVAATIITVPLTKAQMVSATADLGPPLVCGDGRLAANETCDDGATAAGDGCSDTCLIEAGYLCSGEPSVCARACGNGVIDSGESCDDGARVALDGCSDVCAIETGYSCTGAPSMCRLLCGNGVVDAGETCDDGAHAALDGCSATCTIEAGYACTGAPSTCTLLCGNGIRDVGEACDDNNRTSLDGCAADCTVEPLYECTANNPSVCTLLCGNGRIDPNEKCDGALLDANTCWSRGHLDGAAGLACAPSCAAFTFTGCGAEITATTLQQAVTEVTANATGPEVIALVAGAYDLTGTVTVNEGGASPLGFTLRPLSGVVEIGMAAGVTGSARVFFDVKTKNVRIEGLSFLNAYTGVNIENGADDAVVSRCEFVDDSSSTLLSRFVASNALRTIVDGNAFYSRSTTTSADSAISLQQHGTVAGNVISGKYTTAIKVAGAAGGTVKIDNNTIDVAAQSTAVYLEGSTGLCLRNNLISGPGVGSNTTGYFLSGIVFGDTAVCGDISEKNNVVVAGAHRVVTNCSDATTECSLTDCGTAGVNKLCASETYPGFDENYCLPAASPLADIGLPTGYDLVDGDPALFLGVAPDLGARESGSHRTYGGITTSCP